MLAEVIIKGTVMMLKLYGVCDFKDEKGRQLVFEALVVDKANREQGRFNLWTREVKPFWSNLSRRDSIELWEAVSPSKGPCLVLGIENNGDGMSTSGVPSAKARINISNRSILIHRYNRDGSLVIGHSLNCLIPTPVQLKNEQLSALAEGSRLQLQVAGDVELKRLMALKPTSLIWEDGLIKPLARRENAKTQNLV